MTVNIPYMQQALDLAKKGRYTVSPNPMVGCLIVKNHHVIGSGYHQHAGGPHAEIIALSEAKEQAKDAIVYVTLEPCCHYNRTPPCTEALIKAKVKKVFIATKDPNPKVFGKGIEQLLAAGIEVETGLMANEANQLNEIFFHFIKHQKPFVFAKWAMSLDGKTITQSDDSKNISCDASRKDSHDLRQIVDAVLVGANTAISDNPQLTVRHTEHKTTKQPIRIVVSSHGKLPKDLNLFKDNVSKTILATTHQCAKDVDKEFASNVEIIRLSQNAQKQVDLQSLLIELGKREITSILVEGGMKIHHSFFTNNLVNKIKVYLAPVIIGDLKQKRILNNVNLSSIETDFILTADYGVPYV